MAWSDDQLLLVTGATGFIGSHVVERACRNGIRTKALVRRDSNFSQLQKWGADIALGSMTEPFSLKGALFGVTNVVHCAGKVGDWGPVSQYREVNVKGLEYLLEAARECQTLRRIVYLSSLGVYEPRDHHGTDESEPISRQGVDGYTISKIEAEELIRHYVEREKLPIVTLRPGFVYGPRDRTVLPRLIKQLKSGRFAFLGTGEQLLNNLYVGNLVDAVILALERNDLVGEAFIITDGRLVTRHEFFHAIADQCGLPKPTRHIPVGVARVLASVFEAVWKLTGQEQAPLLTKARVKFLGYNLEYSCDKARRMLGYAPQVDFRDGIQTTVQWARKAKLA